MGTLPRRILSIVSGHEAMGEEEASILSVSNEAVRLAVSCSQPHLISRGRRALRAGLAIRLIYMSCDRRVRRRAPVHGYL